VFRREKRFACALDALEHRRFSDAEAGFTRWLEENGLSAEERAFLLNKRGVARMGLERRELAMDDFTAALTTLAEYPPALTNVGNLLLENGELERAIAYYERALSGDREYAVAYLNLGVAYKRAGRLSEAVRMLREAQRLERRAASARSSWWRVRRR
jgi:tetratricopeptide (TPR) repeat protein